MMNFLTSDTVCATEKKAFLISSLSLFLGGLAIILIWRIFLLYYGRWFKTLQEETHLEPTGYYLRKRRKKKLISLRIQVILLVEMLLSAQTFIGKVLMESADACLVLADKHSSNPQHEDECNIMSKSLHDRGLTPTAAPHSPFCLPAGLVAPRITHEMQRPSLILRLTRLKTTILLHLHTVVFRCSGVAYACAASLALAALTAQAALTQALDPKVPSPNPGTGLLYIAQYAMPPFAIPYSSKNVPAKWHQEPPGRISADALNFGPKYSARTICTMYMRADYARQSPIAVSVPVAFRW
ncbi:Hypothetical predicted protein [Pelobates cultripes]|uniref:Uncharacterized protein n=1 Tax=Pelobates cultripes TaxID=61616 RepID=A0AAD1VZC5_PELCU|nr:Hypothetical predicted protein [Pelobates cultripes]